MAITTAWEYRKAIKEDLVSNYEEISERAYPEDYLTETADSWTPVYNGDIIELWHKELPNEFVDSWQEIGAGDDFTIISLMRIDIYFWLSALVTELWDEVKEEKEEVA